MATDRLDVRLDPGHRRKLTEVAVEQGAPVSETVRRLIDRAYEETVRARRKRAAHALARLQVEDVPDPDTLEALPGR